MTDTSNIFRFERQAATERDDTRNAAPSHFNDNLLQVDRAVAEFTFIMMMMTVGKRQFARRLLADWWRKATHTS